MATLSGSTIASTYDRLLAMPSGGLNGATLVALTDGNASATCALSVATTSIAISATDRFYLDDGGNTYIYESAADIMDFIVGGVHLLSLDDANSEVVINEGQVDVNFRVEGDNFTNLFFCDGGNDRVGIGTATPGSLLDISAAGEVTLTIRSTNQDDVGIYLQRATTGDAYADFSVVNDGGDFKISSHRSGVDVTALSILHGGNVGIGTASPDSVLHAQRDTTSSSQAIAHIDCSNGNVGSGDILLWLDHSADGTVDAGARWITIHDSGGEIGYLVSSDGSGGDINTAFTQPSDSRWKKDIKDTSLEGLNIINKIKVRDFKWNAVRESKENKQVIGGFVADELYEVYPHAATGTPGAMKDILDEDGNKTGEEIDGMGVTQGNLISVLVKAIQELSAKVTALENA